MKGNCMQQHGSMCPADCMHKTVIDLRNDAGACMPG